MGRTQGSWSRGLWDLGPDWAKKVSSLSCGAHSRTQRVQPSTRGKGKVVSCVSSGPREVQVGCVGWGCVSNVFVCLVQFSLMALISSLVEALFYFVCAVVTALNISTDSMAVSVSPSPVEYRCHAPLAPFVPLSFGGQKIQVNRLLHSSLL
jgi:hypothetical protein